MLKEVLKIYTCQAHKADNESSLQTSFQSSYHHTNQLSAIRYVSKMSSSTILQTMKPDFDERQLLLYSDTDLLQYILNSP